MPEVAIFSAKGAVLLLIQRFVIAWGLPLLTQNDQNRYLSDLSANPAMNLLILMWILNMNAAKKLSNISISNMGVIGQVSAAAVITYRGRSALREVAKVFGLSRDVQNALSGEVWGRERTGIDDVVLRNAGLSPDDHNLQLVLKIARQMKGFPRHLSQHVGGFVIAKDRLDPCAQSAQQRCKKGRLLNGIKMILKR